VTRGDSAANELLSGSNRHFTGRHDTAAVAVEAHYPRFSRSINSQHSEKTQDLRSHVMGVVEQDDRS